MTGWAPMGVCGQCGGTMDPSRATYDKNGVLQCPVCAAKTTIAEGDARAVSSTVGSAVGIFAGGALSITCVNPFLLVSLVTVVSAIGWILMIARNPTHRDKMGVKFVPCLVVVIFGLMLGAVHPALAALGITAMVFGR